MCVLPDRAAMRARVDEWRAEGARVGLVPTMGAVHLGHQSLCRVARRSADRVLATVFVNPRQFAEYEDLDAYPRGLDEDVDALVKAGADAVYAPSREAMYPEGYETEVRVLRLGEPLEGAVRPHFFSGVATVVFKLFNQIRPDVAVFGEKDYQQLLVLRRMARDLDFEVEVLGAPTVREVDGLAMSSRNRYLTPLQRRRAPELCAALAAMAADLREGFRVDESVAKARRRIADAGFGPIEYVAAADAQTLAPLGPEAITQWDSARLLAAAWLGKARLIDNLPVAELGD